MDRIIRGVLSCFILVILGGYYLTDVKDDENLQLVDNSEYSSTSQINDENKKLDVFLYTNTSNHPVFLNYDDVLIKCNGSGESKESDEALAQKNYQLNVKFSKDYDGKLSDSLIVDRKEQIYIHVMSYYTGYFPINSVNCEYSISIASS